ncbi:MAG: glycoside hydrolase family 127 protein, partial [Kiritimatiellae bacterium]|nr:glycoside hydrolase family 127 protein [Kiritimatiellia bacterium]
QLMQALLESQDESGYIGIYTKDCRFQHAKENGEFWTQSRALLAMLAHFELTGNEEHLLAVERAIGLTMQHYGPGHSYFNNESPAGGTGHGLMLVDVLEWLFRLTGNEDYRNYGIWCYQDYCSAKNIRDVDNHLDRLLRLDEGFLWHTPHTTEHLRVPLWVYYVTGDPKFGQASENSLTKIKRYLGPSGACIGSENIDNKQPTADMPYEYCAITELLTSLQSAYQKTGQPAWGDMVEWIAFNAAQGARLPDGKAISYLTKDNRRRATEKEHGSRTKLSPTHEDVAVCCNPNAVKLLPYYTSRMWLHLTDSEGICAFCYGPSQLRTNIAGKPCTIIEETEYPFSEKILFRIFLEEPLTFELRLRIPSWATGYDLNADGAEVTEDGAFCRVHKTWNHGDCIRLSFQCKVEPVLACNDEVAVRRGPLLYSLPLPGERTVLREYEKHGFFDWSITPSNPVEELRVDPDDMNFKLKHDRVADTNRPWAQSPISLAGSLLRCDGEPCTVSLLPLGCTVLRQTTFPQYRKAQPAFSNTSTLVFPPT